MADNTEIQRRRTFAIIAHPDAGKTSLTEKLLLFGGQIQVAGAIFNDYLRYKQSIDAVSPLTKVQSRAICFIC